MVAVAGWEAVATVAAGTDLEVAATVAATGETD